MHNDLNDHLWTGGGLYPNGGYDFLDDDLDPYDPGNGHGTVVSGIVCGDGTSGDATGVAPDALLMILKTYWNTDMHDAVDFAIAGGTAAYGFGDPADVITASVGFERANRTDAVWQNLKNQFRDDAIVVLAAGMCWTYAAGNGNQWNPPPAHYNAPDDIIVAADSPPPWRHPDQAIPGGLSAVITVGATNNARSRVSFSSYGPTEWDNANYSDYPYNPQTGLLKPDIMAPGSLLRSLSNSSNNGYVNNQSGTSFAAPHVAGAIALMLSKDASLTPERIDSILENTTQPVTSIDPAGKDSLNGSGFLDVETACLGIGNAKKAILWVKNDPAATGYLMVTNITHKEPWVVKVKPTSFSVAPDDSQAVDVWADTTGFGPFNAGPNNFDTLFIESNSQSKTTTAVQVILDYPGELHITLTSLTATGYPNKIELRWRTESEFNIEAWQITRSETTEGDYTMVGGLPGYGTTSQPHNYSFTDDDVVGGRRYYYKLALIDNMGTTVYGPVSAVAKVSSTLTSFSLSSNPARDVSIRFNLADEAQVSLKIYSVTGRLVKTLVNGTLNPKSYNIQWDGTDNNGKRIGSGLYFIRMDADGEKSTAKLALLK